VLSYRPYLTEDNVNSIKALVKKQYHYLITPEIRKALSPQSHGDQFKEELMDITE
jgi:hypothetical protein